MSLRRRALEGEHKHVMHLMRPTGGRTLCGRKQDGVLLTTHEVGRVTCKSCLSADLQNQEGPTDQFRSASDLGDRRMKSQRWMEQMKDRVRQAEAVEVLDETKQITLCHVVHGDYYGQKGHIICRNGQEKFVQSEDELLAELRSMEADNQQELKHQLRLTQEFQRNTPFRNYWNTQREWSLALSNDGIHLFKQDDPNSHQGPFTDINDLLNILGVQPIAETTRAGSV